MTINELRPVLSRQQSFYGKAIVEVQNVPEGVLYKLYSYNTPVARVTKTANNKVLDFDYDYGWSRTTNKHIRDFIYQYANYTI